MTEQEKELANAAANGQNLLEDELLGSSLSALDQQLIDQEGNCKLPTLEEKYDTNIIRFIAIKGARMQSPVRMNPFRNKHGQLRTGQEQLPEEQMRKKYVSIVTNKSLYVMVANGTLDLNNPYDLITWNWVKYCPDLALSADEVNDNTLFFVENTRGLISKKRTMRELRDEATDLVRAMRLNELMDLAAMLGETDDNFSREELQEAMREIADKQPQRIIDVHRSPEKKFTLYLAYLRHMGIIKKEKGGFWYNQTIIGLDETGVIAWLKDPVNGKILTGFEEVLRRAKKI